MKTSTVVSMTVTMVSLIVRATYIITMGKDPMVLVLVISNVVPAIVTLSKTDRVDRNTNGSLHELMRKIPDQTGNVRVVDPPDTAPIIDNGDTRA